MQTEHETEPLTAAILSGSFCEVYAMSKIIKADFDGSVVTLNSDLIQAIGLIGGEL